jgi:hypothetical protein
MEAFFIIVVYILKDFEAFLKIFSKKWRLLFKNVGLL